MSESAGVRFTVGYLFELIDMLASKSKKTTADYIRSQSDAAAKETKH